MILVFAKSQESIQRLLWVLLISLFAGQELLGFVIAMTATALHRERV
jgi:hypothetical protein